MGRKRLLSSCFTSLFAWIKAVTDPGLGDDVTLRAFALDLFSQLSYKDAQIFRLLHTLASPNGVEQRAMGDHLAGVLGHISQQFEFFGGKVHFPATHSNRMRFQVDMEVTNFNRGCALRQGWNAPQLRPYSGQQLVHIERLGYVVVGAGIERFNLGALFALD